MDIVRRRIANAPPEPHTPSTDPDALKPDAVEQERLDLGKLKVLINEALADGKITRQEFNAIRTAALADGKITDEECSLFSSLILEKVKKGEIKMEW